MMMQLSPLIVYLQPVNFWVLSLWQFMLIKTGKNFRSKSDRRNNHDLDEGEKRFGSKGL